MTERIELGTTATIIPADTRDLPEEGRHVGTGSLAQLCDVTTAMRAEHVVLDNGLQCAPPGRSASGSTTSLVTPTPLLVVHGTVDPVVPPQYARHVHAAAGEPKSMVWIETTNHVQIYDIEPYVSQATAALLDWLMAHVPV